MADPPHGCELMHYALTEGTLHIRYQPRYRQYVLEYANDGSVQHMNFCPFCGARLPESLRPTWFDRLRAMGLEPFDDPIPREYQTDEWWREAGL